MDINTLQDSLSVAKQEFPQEVDIIEIRPSSVEAMQQRLRKLLKTGSDACGMECDRGDWTTYDDRTLVRLPQGAHAVLYHASGTIKLSNGLAPMEHLFKEMEPKGALTAQTERIMTQFAVHEDLARGETLTFERLWQIKACAADRSGKSTAPVLCRAVGAFRQHIHGVPVLGPASVAVQIANAGVLDSIVLAMRGPTGEVMERTKVLPIERVARQMAQQIAARFSQGNGHVHVEVPDGIRFGYLNLPKRKKQRLLAPVYLAMVNVTHTQERQAFVAVLPATEKNYLPLDLVGAESLIGYSSKTNGRRNRNCRM